MIQKIVFDSLLDILDNATLVWTGGHSMYHNGWMWDNYREPFNSTFWISGENTSCWRFIWIKYLTQKFHTDVWELHNSCLILDVGTLESKFQCLALNGSSEPGWLNQSCADRKAFICEKSGMLCNMEITIWDLHIFKLNEELKR